MGALFEKAAQGGTRVEHGSIFLTAPIHIKCVCVCIYFANMCVYMCISTMHDVIPGPKSLSWPAAFYGCLLHFLHSSEQLLNQVKELNGEKKTASIKTMSSNSIDEIGFEPPAATPSVWVKFWCLDLFSGDCSQPMGHQANYPTKA